ncbi:MAG: hypothetical protein H0X27_14045 [Caulobacteraceae bacterium]|nr:hypothetical protein [Caulobacteraceae bacterium]
MSLAFDTLSAAKTLKNAGFDEAGAEAIMTLVKHSSGLPTLDHLASRDDLDKAVMSLKLFVASTVLGGAAVIVLAQIVSKALGVAG